jgi:hypothetical protein
MAAKPDEGFPQAGQIAEVRVEALHYYHIASPVVKCEFDSDP